MTAKSRTMPVVIFLAPFLLIYISFQVYPLVQAAVSSLYDWDLLTSQKHFIGIDNYLRMFTDPTFWDSFKHTLQFVIYSTPIIVFSGLLLAILLNGRNKFLQIYRTIFFAPYVLSVSVTTLIWGFMFNPQKGLLGALSTLLGTREIYWLTDPNYAMSAIIITTVWWTVGFNLVLFLAGLQDIDGSLYEASMLDGANSLQRFRYITIPGLSRTFMLVLVLQIIASFQIFGQVYIMTKGGPGGTTRVLIQYIYEAGFRDYELGYASAMAVFLFMVMFIISYIQFAVFSEEKK
ncbi:MAG: sugar ABC transporter permease [Spirochaetia bacterium]|nr:sugar ABC transporter permease [Spirochaetia bacterium]